MRVTLVAWAMKAGGAEKVLSVLANAWAARGDEVTLLALTEEHPSHFPLDGSVAFRCLGFAAGAGDRPGRIGTFVERIFALRRALRDSRPDVIVSFLDRVNTLTVLSSIGLRVPVIVSERIDPSVWKDIQPWQFLRSCAYPLANAVVSQTATVAQDLRRLVGKRSVAISNPVPAAEACGGIHSGKRLLGCGRLCEQKRLDRLIEAFYLLHKRFPQWSLTIAGEGELRPQLAQQIAALGLGDRVSLSGTYSNPREILKDADLFILSSAFEGFPNTLAEAMAHGVPVISFDCRSGPSEIIRNGVDGLLVPPCDVPALAAAMEKLMSNEALRLSMGKRAVEVSERFSVDKILRAWDDLFEQLGAPVSRSRQSASRPLDGVLGGDAR